MPETIESFRWYELRVSPKTVWTFVELLDGSGRMGVGEATLAGREPHVRAALQSCISALVVRPPCPADLAPARRCARTLADYAAVSALDQAAWDLEARQQGKSVSALLGARRNRIEVYANINRGIESRTADGFAARARQAVADGFSALKIAPFDGVELYGREDRAVDRVLLDAGIERIAAVRSAAGPSVELMVDCHWRLNRTTAEAVLRAVEPLKLYWFECPVPETREMLPTIRALRTVANERGVRLAGCEEMSLLEGFTPFIEAGAYDVLMPDVKYVGGLRETLKVADALDRAGIIFSPHNPSGPVAHAASLHVCAAAAQLGRLELQYAETPLFDRLVGNALPAAIRGVIEVPTGPGLGVSLDPALARELAVPGTA